MSADADSDTDGDTAGLAGAWNLSLAFSWRLGREGKRYLLAPVVPFVVILAFVIVLSTVGGGRLINGAGSDASVASRYADGTHAVTVGLLLTLGPAMVGLFSAIAVTRMVQGLIGAEVNRGGFEELLSTPHTPGRIAKAMLGHTAVVAAGFWAAFTVVEALAVAIVVGTMSVRLSLTGGYLACALVLPLLVSWAGGSLALLVSLLFPRLTQMGGAIGLSGGSVGNVVAVLPGLGGVYALSYGLPRLGPVLLLLAAGGVTALVAVGAMVTVAAGFRPETVLDS